MNGCQHQTSKHIHFFFSVLHHLTQQMESLSKVDEPFPTPSPYFLPDESQAGQDVRIYHIHSPFSPPPPLPSFSFSPGVACSTHSTFPASAPPPSTPRLKFVSYETELYRSPALTTCPSCQTQVTTQVTYQVGKYAWLMCLVFVLCGLVLGCCLIPFFVNSFKDAYHTCPRCRRVLHVHRKTCCG
ncbi:lipopolysaccharide-induced tumor necrosis factor-alpha factor homolog [Thunnus thynnus]|uniref:lipopolysaccharide-induced tumor necrosis factor-alpha factor homolog n=1 Tax=Thunnus thynnus TaxID=8237 RepID=UPI003528D1CB